MNSRALILIIFLFSIISYAQEEWKKIPSPAVHNLTRIIFKDSLTGWASGDSGAVLHTSTGGLEWDFQNTGIKTNIQNLFFLDSLRGWAVSWYSKDTSYGTYLLNTVDGGLNWNRDSLTFHKEYINTVMFLDSATGFIGGPNGSIYRTTDAGLNWNKAVVDTFVIFYGIFGFNFYNELYGIAYGGLVDVGGIVWKTTDGGLHWRGSYIATEPIRQMYFYDSLNVLAIGGDAEYGISKYNSTDAGESWIGANLSVLAVPMNLSFRTKSEAWIPLGFVTTFLVTRDSGKSWKEQPVPDSYTIYDINFPDSLHGYAVGLDGVILKYIYKPVLVEEENPQKINGFKLDQNYPNPFNASTEISFTINVRSETDLSIFDMLGRKITTLLKGELGKGSYSIRFNAASLPSGIYYYRLTSGNYFLTKKAVLLK